MPILSSDEPNPVLVYQPHGNSEFFLACDHADRRIPAALGTLGLPDSELRRHIGWDIGIWAVTRMLADALGAFAIGQLYSRLVIDCNRTPGVLSSIPLVSESTEIPGNDNLSDADRDARAKEIFWPYHHAVAAALDARTQRQTVVIAMHSFTPVYQGFVRPWHAGILFNRDDRLARPMLDLLSQEPGMVVGENEPYAVSDATDYTVPVHCERRHLPHLELEIRQDLIEDEAGQREWAERLARLLPDALRHMMQSEKK